MGDCREVIADLTTLLRTEAAAGRTGDYEQWVDYVAGLKKRYPVAYDQPADGSLAPQYVLERLSAIAGPDAIYCAGVGQHQMWAAHYIDFEKPAHLDQLRRPRHDGVRRARRDGRQGRAARRRRCGRSTATAASR